MRALCALLAAPLLFAQPAAQSHPPQPPGLEVFQRVYRSGTPLGANDRAVAEAWASALAAGPLHPSFSQAAIQTASYFSAQGYDLKAEQIYRQALAATGQQNPDASRMFRQSIAVLYHSAGQLVKATALYRELLGETPETANARRSLLQQVASLEEQMGEIEAAEAHLKELISLPTPRQAPGGNAQGAQFGAFLVSRRSFSSSYYGQANAGSSALASFYARHDKADQAESLMKQAIEDARQKNSPPDVHQALRAYADFLRSNRRYDEAAALARQTIAELENSSGPEMQRSLVYERNNLAHLLNEAGKKDQALALLEQNVQAQSASSQSHVEALQMLANMLIHQQRFDDAEKAVMQFRQAADSQIRPHHQRMGDQMLAQLRMAQGRTEEANKLQQQAMPPELANQPVPIWTLIQPAQQALQNRNYDQGLALADKALAAAADRVASNPGEIVALAQLVHALPPERANDRIRLIRSMLGMLDGVTPADHPRLVDAFSQLTYVLSSSGMTAEAQRLLDRQERIIMAAKGEGSMALNQVSQQRGNFFSMAGDRASALAEAKRVLERSEAAAGPGSHQTISALRDLANAYHQNGNWPEEERTRVDLINRSKRTNPASPALVHEISGLASRYHQQGQFEQAVAYMDQAMELARRSPEAPHLLPGLVQQREYFQQTKNQPPQQPGVTNYRWFDTGSINGISPTGRRVSIPAQTPPLPAPVKQQP